MVKNAVIINDHGYICGGASKIALQTAVGLAESGINVYFFCAVGPVSDELARNNIKTICLGQQDSLHCKNKIRGFRQGIYNKKAAKELEKLLGGLDPKDTVVHLHTWTKALSSSVFGVADKAGYKIFLTVHDYFLVCPNGGLFNYKKKKICEIKPMSPRCRICNCDSRNYAYKIFRVLRQSKQNRIIRKCKNLNFIFISEFSKTQFLRRFGDLPENKQYFLPNPTDFANERKRVKCENNETYLFIGSITEIKGIRTFCEAVTKAGVKATVIGEGMLKAEMQAAYPDIEFVGWKTKTEMLPYIKQVRCLIFPSIWYEAAPLTPLEIMAYGIPVICSDKNAAKDYIEDGITGYIYNGTNTDELVYAIMKTLNTDIKEISEKTFESFDKNRYSEKEYILCLIKIYNVVKENGKETVAS